MSDPYTLQPSGLDPTGVEATAPSVFAPTRQPAFAARMLRSLMASPLRLYSWSRGNLPRRLIDVLAAELELQARVVSDVAYRAISESTYRAWEDPALFPPRGARTLARGVVTVYSYGELPVSETFPVGSLFGSADGRTVRSEQAVVFAAGTSSVNVPVVSEVPGEAGNLLAGQLRIMLSGRLSYPCSNTSPISGGREAESDADMRVRFQDFVESRATASRLSVFSAAMNTFIPDPVDPALQQRPDDAALLLPWTGGDLNSEMAHGYVVVDGGGGQATPELLAAVQEKLERIQAAGDTFVAVPVNPWVVNLDVVALTARAADVSAVALALAAAWGALAAGPRIEDGRGRGRLTLFDLQRALETAHPDVVTVKILNQAADLQPPRGARLIAGTLDADIRPGGAL